MEREQEFDLEITAREYFNNPSHFNQGKLIEEAQRLIYFFVKKYGLGRLKEDLVQSGYEGLIKAIKNFDPERGVRFTTYASHLIMGEIRHEIRRQRRFECPNCIIEIQDKVTTTIDEHFKKNGTIPSPKEISKLININEEGIIQSMQAGLVSFEEIDTSKIQNLNHRSFQVSIEDKITLQRAFQTLSFLQKKVLYLLFYQGKTQKEIAIMLNTNQRQISRIKEKSLKVLKENLKDVV